MYAIINTGGKQYKVEEGDEIVVSSKSALEKAKIGFSIVKDTAGKKIDGFNYKNKTNQRKRYGHRQKYHVIKIDKITA